MTLAHRVAFWLVLLVCALLIIASRPEPQPWPNGDGDLVEVRDD